VIVVIAALAAALLLAQPATAHHDHTTPAWQWRWQKWLPPVWQRIGACETGYGKRPGNWHWNSGTYQGAFGFHRSSWDAFRLPGYPTEAYNATPWQQYRVALAIHRRYGFTGWGCYTHHAWVRG
jgi:hypothetical protein